MRNVAKKLDQQTIVITGASSGIGLATAKLAAERGARVVLAARNASELEQVAGEIRQGGGQASCVAVDVADPSSVEHLADEAVRTCGGFDTWVNDAGVSIFGRSWETKLDDERRLFDVNYWGVVHGCRAALPHLRERGGTIINVGSVVSDRAVPLQGAYCASKHAVKAYTDALRMEVEADGAPVNVTLVKPGAIDTPFFAHAESEMETEPKAPAPVYAPEVVARAILACAEKPVREITVGGAARALSLFGMIAPRLSDLWMERFMFEAQKKDELAHGRSSLYAPGSGGSVSGGHPGHVSRSSLYTEALLSDAARLAPALALGAATLYLMRGRRQPAGLLARTVAPVRRAARRVP
ncbi:MAG: SDR family oxidoreductase, partial [Thermodesulfobacteriota bacterium]